jgi:hypothetical protein
VTRTRKAGMRALAVGLAAGALGAGAGTTTAATPAFAMHVHARLAPVSGTAAAGRFDGLLAMSGVGVTPASRTAALPRPGEHWRLAWKVTLPASKGPTTASLQIKADSGAASVTRLLCVDCTAGANGILTLPWSQALRIVASDAEVVVHTASTTLRGEVRVDEARPQPTP